MIGCRLCPTASVRARNACRATGAPSTRWRLRGLVGLLGLVLLVPSAIATAKEPAAEFLQALRDAGYHDLAQDYLEQMQASPLAPAAFREIQPYELGGSLLALARSQHERATRERFLAQAQASLERFVRGAPSHALTPAAKLQLGSVLVERGRLKVEQAKAASGDRAALRTALQAEARQLYDEAYRGFVRTQDELKEKLAPLKTVAPDGQAASELRDRLRADYVQAQLLAAAIQEEMAEAVEPDSPEYERLLTVAATAYGQLYEAHRTRLAGLSARLYQARCQLKLHKLPESLTLLRELLDQPDTPEEIRRFKADAFVLALEAWTQSKPALLAEAVSRLTPFLESAPPPAGRQEVWEKLRLELAKAQWALAQEFRGHDQASQAAKLEQDARRQAAALSRRTGEYQLAAQQLLASWGGAPAESSRHATSRTFAEAKRAGLEALESLQTANLVLNAVPARIAAETDATVKAELQQQLHEAQVTAHAAVAAAEPAFRRAVCLAGREADVPLEDVNSVRYFLSFLHYSRGDYLEAAVLGEFVARRYPGSPLARECAKIALAAYGKLYNGSKSADRTFEVARLTALADYILQQGAGQPEAGETLSLLLPLLIREGQFDAAEKYLQATPPDSPQRVDAELRMGQALWGTYLKGMQQLRPSRADPAAAPSGPELVSRQAALQLLRTRAQTLLADRVGRLQQSGAVSPTAAVAALSLVQIYLDSGQVDRAVNLLEEPTIGPLTLVTQGSAAVAREGFAGEAYKTALRAYISSLPDAADSDAIVAKALRVMEALQKTLPAEQLVTLYVGFARDLEEQVQLATPERKHALARGFEAFVTRIRSDAKDFSVLNWVATTFLSLGSSFDDGDLQLNPEEQHYFGEAAKTYEAVLKLVPSDEPQRKRQVLLQAALTQRRLHKFMDAKKIYLELLRENATLCEIQLEAARMYQEWAAFPGKMPLYERAIRGAEPDAKTGANVIWGWAYLAQVAARQPQARQIFHEARYNLALCRYQWGLAQQAKTEQGTLFEKAKQDILRTRELYGTGPAWEAWQPRYDALLQKIEKH